MAGLASLSPGASVAVEAVGAVPALAGRLVDETDTTYAARLVAADGSAAGGAGYATGVFAGRRVVTPVSVASSTLGLPVVRLAGASLAASAEVGDGLDVGVALSNEGSEAASAVALVRSVGSASVAGTAPTTLAAGAVADLPAVVTVDASLAGSSVGVTREVRWEDRAGNAYGAMGGSVSVSVVGLPELTL